MRGTVFRAASQSTHLIDGRLQPSCKALQIVSVLVWLLLSATPSPAHEGTDHRIADKAPLSRHSLLHPERSGPDLSRSQPVTDRNKRNSKVTGNSKRSKKVPPPIQLPAVEQGGAGLPAAGSESRANMQTTNSSTPSMGSPAVQLGTNSKSSTSVTQIAPTISVSSAPSLLGAAAAGNVAAATDSTVVGNNMPTSPKIQRLLKEMPGLTRLLMVSVPVEATAPPAPPLPPPAPGLPAPPANWFAYHVLNRVAYGGTPNQLNTVSHLNATQAREWGDRYMKEQLGLDPNRPWPTNLLHSTEPLPPAIPIVDSDTDLLLMQDKADWRRHEDDPSLLVPDLAQLQDHDLIRKIYSRRQLLEKMVYFWENHFNTDYRSHFAGQYELFENEQFRRLAFGRFIDLLTTSAKSPAMMVYLNTDVNVKENPNENYAREVLELHTLGVDDQGRPAGYTQADIEEAAKTFTGWDTPNGPTPGFRFVSSRHSLGSKTVLGQTIPFDGTGPSEGERVLQMAAAHPSTARHLAKKLCEYFVSETPSAALVNEVASVYTDSGGDIRKVLIAIFTSPDFRDVRNYRTLVKTPLEFVVGLYRNLGIWSSRDPFRSRLTRIGQGLYEMPSPTGYKEKSDHWLNTHVLFHEVGLAYEATIPGFGSSVRYGTDTGGLTRVWLKNLGLKTEQDVLGFLLNLTLDRQVTSTEYQIYLSTLRSGGGTFNLDNASIETSLDRTLATILANPRYLYQ